MDVVAVRWMSLEWQRRRENIQGFRQEGKLSWTEDVVIWSVGMSEDVKRGMCNQ